MVIGLELVIPATAGFLALVAYFVRRPRWGLAVSLLLFIPAPLFPTPESDFLFYGFAAFTALVLIGWIQRLFRAQPPFGSFDSRDRVGLSLMLWFLLSAIGLPLCLVFNTGTFSERMFFYLKGLLPFLYLFIFFVVRALPFSFKDAKRVLDYVLIVAVAFALLSYGIFAVTHARVISFYVPLAFPFVVLGANVTLSRMLTARSKNSFAQWCVLTILLVIAVLLNFTKAQVIALVASFLLMAYLVSRNLRHHIAFRRFVTLVCVFTLLALVCTVFMSNAGQDSFMDLVETRLHDQSSEQTRVAEITEALAHFTTSPIVGKGIGFQMERDVLGETLTSGYVHNQTAYTAMTMGTAGLIVFGMLICSWAQLLSRVRLLPEAGLTTIAALHGCILSLFAYAELFATFRTIQHNLLLGTFLGLVVRLTPKQAGERVTSACALALNGTVPSKP